MNRLDLKLFRTVTPGFTRRCASVRTRPRPLYGFTQLAAVCEVTPTRYDRPKTAVTGADAPILKHSGVTVALGAQGRT
jgi:hypothetical protein